MTFSLINNKLNFSWEDIYWGYKHHLIGWKDVVCYASDKISHGNDNEVVIDISLIDKHNLHELDELLEKVAVISDDYNNDKWLYFKLLILFISKDEINDPLGEVEKVYDFFDYPEEIESFIRCMPATGGYDPSKHTAEENIQRLNFNWKDYLDNKMLSFLK
ncbi:DUF2247 family protein [Cronobacter muytjensii]|nr:DUF2247 family protein [Cronobacter muytjensii]